MNQQILHIRNIHIASCVGAIAFLVCVNIAVAQVPGQEVNGTFISNEMQKYNGSVWDGLALDESTGTFYLGNSTSHKIWKIEGEGNKMIKMNDTDDSDVV